VPGTANACGGIYEAVPGRSIPQGSGLTFKVTLQRITDANRVAVLADVKYPRNNQTLSVTPLANVGLEAYIIDQDLLRPVAKIIQFVTKNYYVVVTADPGTGPLSADQSNALVDVARKISTQID
jgi:hypothetical protein